MITKEQKFLPAEPQPDDIGRKIISERERNKRVSNILRVNVFVLSHAMQYNVRVCVCSVDLLATFGCLASVAKLGHSSILLVSVL